MTPMTPMTTDSSLKRGLAVLRLFAQHPPQDPRGHTAAEVAALLGRERSQVSRILRSLETARFLRRDPASLRYSVAWELYARAQQITEARLRRDGRTALEGVAADTRLNQADGLHPTAEGVDVIVKNILPMVEALLGTLSAQRS